VVVSAFCYSLFPVFTKTSLEEGLSPTDLLFWRFVIAAPVAWLLLGVRAARGGPDWRAAPARMMLALGFVFGLMAYLAFAGLDHLPAALYTVIIYTYPAMVAIGSWLIGRPAPKALWGALVVTMFGISLTVPEVFAGSGGADTIGLWLTLMNAALYAVYLLVSGSLSGRAVLSGVAFDGIAASTWSMTGSLVYALVTVAFVGLTMPQSFGAVVGLVGLALISTVAAGWTLMVGLSKLGAARAALLATIEPVLTLTWAVVLLGETLVPIQILGAIIVVIGVIWTQQTSAGAPPRRRRTTEVPV
jgi:drug/metabolite transporter (DMT)-like permease